MLKVGGSAPPQPGVEIPTGAFVAKITNDAREEEMEENMQQVRVDLIFIYFLFYLNQIESFSIFNYV